LRHRIKQAPLRGIVKIVREKAAERGSSFIMISDTKIAGCVHYIARG
jgi:hypothetical protein